MTNRPEHLLGTPRTVTYIRTDGTHEEQPDQHINNDGTITFTFRFTTEPAEPSTTDEPEIERGLVRGERHR
jgi:hypothetical protein